MSYDLKTLRDLEKRLAGARGADREIDADMTVAFFGGEIVWGQTRYTMEALPAHRYPCKNHLSGFANEHVPLLTASLDAAVALVERVLPGWRIFFTYTLGSGVCQLRLIDVTGQEPRDDEDWPLTKGCAATPALALCLACVRALIAQEEAA